MWKVKFQLDFQRYKCYCFLWYIADVLTMALGFVLSADGGKVKAKGTIFLSNIRMVFLANKPVGNFTGFDIPLVRK